MLHLHQKEIEKLRECTFRPQITVYNNISLEHSGNDFYNRAKAWEGEREKRIDHERQTQLQEENKVCSFRPDVNVMSKIIAEEGVPHNSILRDAKIYDEGSIKKHIQRQLVAQFDKFVKDTILTQGKPPKRQMLKLIKSASVNKLLPKSASLDRHMPKRKLHKRNKSKLVKKRRENKSYSGFNRVTKINVSPLSLTTPYRV